MMNSKTLFYDLAGKILLKENKEEIYSILYIIFESLFGISKKDILSEKAIFVDDTCMDRLDSIIQRLNKNEPLQYILEEAHFYGRQFYVNSSVLIPRPETEELIQVVLKYIKGSSIDNPSVKILDIGTGSGCIPITLSLEMPQAEVYGTDISSNALTVAKKNAQLLQAKVRFIQHDILNEEISFVNQLNVVVSNPPYVTMAEKDSMMSNVVAFEPHLALFVPDNDPLIFYKVIVNKTKKIICTNGLLAVEINEAYGKEVAELFLQSGFRKVQIVKDIFNKDRMVTGILGSGISGSC
jgi:release factor glutamine methyltransferase